MKVAGNGQGKILTTDELRLLFTLGRDSFLESGQTHLIFEIDNITDCCTPFPLGDFCTPDNNVT